MIKTNRVVIVEGKYDTGFVENVIQKSLKKEAKESAK